VGHYASGQLIANNDPLEEEMFMPPHSSLEASGDKFGKVTWGQPFNGFVLNQMN
jgi:hypothetical protein